MNTLLAMSSSATTLLLAWVGHRLPLARPPLFFGLPVEAGYRESAGAQGILRGYRLANALGALAGLALAFSTPLLAALATVAPVLTMLSAFYYARGKVRPHLAPTGEHIRRASLRPPVSNWIWVWMLPPLFVLAASAMVLYFGWNRIPERFPIHWDISGVANGWAARTPRKVFATLMIGAATWALLCLTMAGLLYGTRRAPGLTPVIRASVFALVATMWLLSILMAAIGLQPLAPDPTQPLVPFWVALLLPVVLIGVVLVPLSKVMSVPVDPEEAAYYAGGEIYANPEDPAWMVPKASGLGFTYNFGHPVGRYVFPAVILLFLGFVYYVTR